ncbi:protein ROOT PRIMORDIUM DEFECTIVE 1 [Artemisia annua]|uniref:Protein ROOT PRIMORDIUM DEFECTIVE 1 n=1 Tax=Artemisia annua TaxID=35608 RepID=A0A2U1N0W3_ARTAN|nr:protein ROOT PRIMORDIUM DEFECTIVE 1 [Artemisia annua]
MKIQNRKRVINIYMQTQRFSLWSMKKGPDLEAALTRNHRWKKFKSLDLQWKALNWLKKYPCCFKTYLDKDEYYCRLTKKMMFLVEEEEQNVKDMQEPVVVRD